MLHDNPNIQVHKTPGDAKLHVIDRQKNNFVTNIEENRGKHPGLRG